MDRAGINPEDGGRQQAGKHTAQCAKSMASASRRVFNELMEARRRYGAGSAIGRLYKQAITAICSAVESGQERPRGPVGDPMLNALKNLAGGKSKTAEEQTAELERLIAAAREERSALSSMLTTLTARGAKLTPTAK